VWLQFRPLTGPNGGNPTPNPSCDPAGLVTSFSWSNDDQAISGTPATGYFIGSNPYNVCVYLVNPVVASDTIDSAAINGATAALPTGLNGNYRINVSGTWTNGSNGIVDAEYTSDDSWATSINGYNRNGFNLGEGFGDVQVNGGFVGWGASNSDHAYSYATWASPALSTSQSSTATATRTRRTRAGMATTAARWTTRSLTSASRTRHHRAGRPYMRRLPVGEGAIENPIRAA
jgi:hypothetical protein